VDRRLEADLADLISPVYVKVARRPAAFFAGLAVPAWVRAVSWLTAHGGRMGSDVLFAVSIDGRRSSVAPPTASRPNRREVRLRFAEGFYDLPT
jgi:hypothetical protein